MESPTPVDSTGAAAACGPGDSRRDRRRRAILESARTLFFEKGYEATTLGEIVARSGGSLSTLYELFGNKTGLLGALVCESCETVAAVIDSVTIAGLEAHEALCTVARHLFDKLTDPGNIALYRVIITESARQPDFGRRFYDAGPATGRRLMGAFLAGQAHDGVLRIDDPDEAANYFFHMLLGDYQDRLLCGLAPPSLDEARRHIDRTVDAFLRLYAVR